MLPSSKECYHFWKTRQRQGRFFHGNEHMLLKAMAQFAFHGTECQILAIKLLLNFKFK
jgi:hypothetical protein